MKTPPKRQLLRRALIIGSFILFPVTIFYFSPALIVMGAAAGIVSGSAMVFTAQFLAALVLGRAFCGWVCPAAGQQEACFIAQSKRVNRRRSDWVKYAIWVPWLGVIGSLFLRNGVRSADFFFQMDSPISLSSPSQYPVYFVVTALVLVLSLSVGRRGFCHAACWMAPFMILGQRLQSLVGLPALHLRSEPTRCVECRTCVRECPMSLEVTEMVKAGNMRNDECVLCGTCGDVCTTKAISFAFGIRKTPSTSAGGGD